MNFESGKNTKGADTDFLLKEGENLHFRVAEINHLLQSITDQLKVSGELKHVLNLMLTANESRIEIGNNFANFLEGTDVSVADLQKFRNAVDNLEAIKRKVLSIVDRLGYEVEYKNGAPILEELSNKENLDLEVASLGDQINDLEREFLTRVGKNNSSSLKVAQVTFKLLTGPQDTDPNIAKGNKQRRLKKIRKMLAFAKEELANLAVGKVEQQNEEAKKLRDEVNVESHPAVTIPAETLEQAEDFDAQIAAALGEYEDYYKKLNSDIYPGYTSLVTPEAAKALFVIEGEKDDAKIALKQNQELKKLESLNTTLKIEVEKSQSEDRVDQIDAVEINSSYDKKSESVENDQEIQELYNLYRTADSNVFEDPSRDGKFKRFPVICGQIRGVLKYAGLSKEDIDEFMAPIEVDLHGEIRKLNVELRQLEKNKAFKQKQKNKKREIADKYQVLLNLVSKKIGNPSGLELEPKTPKTPEEIEKLLSSVKTFKDLYAALDQQDVKNFFAETDLELKIKSLREHVSNSMKLYPSLDKSLVMDVIFNPKSSKITNTGGLRDLVKKLVEEENGIVSEADEVSQATTDEEKTPESVTNTPVSLENFRDARKDLSIASKAFFEKQKEYKKAVEERSSWSKIKGSVGVEDTELQKLKKETEDLRTLYAKALDTALAARAARKRTVRGEKGDVIESDDENTFKYSTLTDEKTKKHFVKKFILKPRVRNQEWLESLQSPTKKTIIKNVSNFLKKNKWGLRAGVILATGVLAGLTGGVGAGLVAGGVKVGRMAWSLKVGSGVALAANAYTNKWVENAGKNLEKTVEGANENFTLDNINSLEAEILKADKSITNARRKQTAATIGAGVLAGGAYGAAAEGAEALFGQTPLATFVTPGFNSEGLPTDNTLSAEKVAATVRAFSQDPTGGSVTSVPTEGTWSTDTDQVAETAVESSEIIISGPEIFLDNSSFGGNNYTVNSWLGYEGAELSVGERSQVDAFIKAAIIAVHNDNHHFNLDLLEKELPSRLAEKFGDQSWWPEKGIAIDLKTNEIIASSSDSAAQLGDSVSPSDIEANQNMYTVQQDDTLSKIVNTKFDDLLKNAPPGQRSSVLYEALNNIQASEDLKQSIGIESGKIDLIYPDKELNLTAVGEEIQKVLNERLGDDVNVNGVEGDENIYTVQKGDTLSEIVNKHFNDELSKVPSEKYSQVLYQLLDRIEASNDLKESLSIKSGDIDLIYPNEKLNLSVIGEELKKVLAENQIGVDGTELIADPTTGPLDIDSSVDTASAVASVDVEGGSEAVSEQPLEASEQVELFPPNDVIPVEGQYFNQPDWQEYVNQRFGSEEAFNKVLTKEVDNIEGLKPNFFERIFGSDVYNSPYEVMSNMTIEELDELREGPDSERFFCVTHDIKYETYRAWQNMVDVLKDNYHYSEETTMADLFKRFVAVNYAPILDK